MSVHLTATRNVIKKNFGSKPVSHSTKKAKVATVAKPGISAHNVKQWEFTMDDDVITVIFRKDKQQIWVNTTQVEVENAFSHDTDGAVIDFDCMSQKGRITTCRNEIGELDQVLTINGIIIE